MKTLSIVLLLSSSVIVTGCVHSNSNQSSDSSQTTVTQTLIPAASSSVDQQSPTSSAEQRDTSTSPTFIYTDYSESALTQARNSQQAIVLFFHADWCPTCVSANAQFEQANASDLPNLTILKIDYDSATELKKQYQIINQHTFVQLDPESGAELQRWAGGGTELMRSQVILSD